MDKSRRPREKSREREKPRPPRSAGRGDRRDPRTTAAVDNADDDHDGREYDNRGPRDRRASFGGDNQDREDRPRPSKPAPKHSDKERDVRSSRGKPQPYVVDRRGRDDPQPYDRQRSPGEAGEASSIYNKSYDPRRPTSRYPAARVKERQEQSREPDDPSDPASVTAGFRNLNLDDGDQYTHYTTDAPLSRYESSHTGDSSYSRPYDTVQPAISTSVYSSQARNPTSATTDADHFHQSTIQPTSDYRQTHADDHPITSPVYSSETRDSFRTTSQYYPAQQPLASSQQPYATTAVPTYSPSQRNVAISDPRQPASIVAKGLQKAQQKLDDSFYVRNRDYMKFFRVGRVFMTLWVDPLGAHAYEQSSLVSDVIYGEKVYSKVRRFIVVREGGDKRSATCLPITSYNGNGLGKSGVQVGEHGFIYSQKEPKKVSGMCSKALRVLLSKNGQHLTDPSLVHYGKVHTVEGNWKVKDIGNLDADSIKTLSHYWRKVFCFVEDDLPEPGMTPRAKEAVLAHVGAGMDSYPESSGQGLYPSTTTAQHFVSTSAPSGYPPVASSGPSGGDRRSTDHYYAQPTYPAASRGGYEHQSSQAASPYGAPSYQTRIPHHGDDPAFNSAPAQGNTFYQGYPVAMAPGRTVSTTQYSTQGPSTTDYYGPQYASNHPPPAGGTAYGTYAPPQQVPQSWAPVGPTTTSRYDETYGYSATGPSTQGHTTPYQNPSGQWEEPASGGTYARQPDYSDSVAHGPTDDIDLPTLADARQAAQARDRRGSKAGETSHRRRRH